MTRSLVHTHVEIDELAFCTLPQRNALFLWSEDLDEPSISERLHMISEQHGIPVLQASWQTTPGIVLLSSTSLRKRFAVHPDHLHELGGYVAEGPALLLGIPWPFALRATVRVMLTVHGDVARLSPLARRLRTEHATLHLYRNALELGETAIRAWCAKASRQR